VSESLGKWTAHYAGLVEPEPYDDSATYQAIADWLAGCRTVEDWGCGKGWLRQYFAPHQYVGVAPTLNTTVIFTTSEHSNHGHPDPLRCPPDRARRSLAVYYFSQQEPPDGGEHRSTMFRRRPGSDEDRWCIPEDGVHARRR
jgi:hypothetical protein